MTKIIFDSNCAGWRKDSEINMCFLVYQSDYIQELLSHRDYIYLNNLYEIFGVKWNPDNENLCWRKETGINIEIGEPDPQGAIEITIT